MIFVESRMQLGADIGPAVKTYRGGPSSQVPERFDDYPQLLQGAINRIDGDRYLPCLQMFRLSKPPVNGFRFKCNSDTSVRGSGIKK